MKILVNLFDNSIVDADSEYIQYSDKVEVFNQGIKGVVYATLNSNNSLVVDVEDFTYDQKTDGGKYKYIDGQIVEA